MGKVISWADIIFELEKRASERNLTPKEKRWIDKICEWAKVEGFRM